MIDEQIEIAARALNLEAGRQRGFAFEDDWETLTEQERVGWRLCARAALAAVETEQTVEDFTFQGLDAQQIAGAILYARQYGWRTAPA